MPRRLLQLVASTGHIANHLMPILTNMGYLVTREDTKDADSRMSIESATINAATSTRDAARMGEVLVERINALIATFVPSYGGHFRLAGVAEQKPKGSWRTSVTIRVSVSLPEAFDCLGSLMPDGTSVLAAMLNMAAENGDVSEALALVSGGPPSWHAVYDVIEFFGNERGIAKRKWATERQVKRHKQTANYYRHRGAPRKYRLPPGDPPTIGESREFVLGLLRRWLEEKLARKKSTRSSA